jgi:hypothetical protein
VTLSGADYGTVVNVSPDYWTWTPPPKSDGTPVDATVGNGPMSNWLEPENSALANGIGGIHGAAPGTLGYGVFSDWTLPFTPDASTWWVRNNGDVSPSELWVGYSDLSYQVFDVQFIDRGDAGHAPSVPDQSSTLGLLLISCFGLELARRTYSARVRSQSQSWSGEPCRL